jgi:HEAT repeat protein
MPARDKKTLLPLFLRALETARSCGPRNNAALALRYYGDEKALVIPALTSALSDTEPYVRLTAAESLNHVDAEAASRAGVVKVLGVLVTDADDQIGGRAASVLRNCRNDADSAVAALIEGLHSTNTYVSCSAVWSLESFPSHADTIIPELRKAAERKDNAAGYAKNAIKSLESRQKR